MIRHLILPGQIENSLRVLDWIGETFPRGTVLVSLMRQYTPMPRVAGMPPLDRQVTQEEYEAVLSWMYLNNLEGFYPGGRGCLGEIHPKFQKAINVCLHFCRTCVILKEKGGGIMPRTSNKQEEILQYIDQFVAENGYPPSVREIGAAVGLRSTASVSYHLNHLQTKGLVTYEAGKKRALSVPNAKTGQIPIIGVVTAGIPILAVENQEGTMPWDGDPNCFALRVRGDSMIGAAILDGDLVVVRPQQSADDGQIVVALLEDEATVKRFRRQRGRVWLQPENPNYMPIDASSAKLVGLVKAVVRNY